MVLFGQVYKVSIGAACGLSWPSDRLVIQVLDDSTDPTIKVKNNPPKSPIKKIILSMGPLPFSPLVRAPKISMCWIKCHTEKTPIIECFGATLLISDPISDMGLFQCAMSKWVFNKNGK